MVAGLVDPVDQRRRDAILPGGIFAVAGRAFCLEPALAKPRLFAEGLRQGDRGKRRPLW